MAISSILRRPVPFATPYKYPTLYSPHFALTSSIAVPATEYAIPETRPLHPPTQEHNIVYEGKAAKHSLIIHNVKTLSGENIVGRLESDDLLGEGVYRYVSSNSFFNFPVGLGCSCSPLCLTCHC